MKEKVYDILQAAEPGQRLSRAFDLFLVSLISLNAVALILSTVDEVHDPAPLAFRAFEIISIAVFTVEYVLRLWCCTVEERYSPPLLGRLWYAVSPLAMVDLLAIVPFYVALFGGFSALDLRLLRTLRLLAQVARLSRYSSGIRTLARVLHEKGPQLLTVIMVLGVLLLIAASLMFFAEHKAQPETFDSIPHAMWWSVITLTTVGYGDAVPVTTWGRTLAGLIAVLGIGLFALPAGILGSGFVQELRRSNNQHIICPYCGGEIHHE